MWEVSPVRTIGEGRYELETELASGAVGTVWRAVDNRTGERVAVKMLRPDAEYRWLAGPPQVAAREYRRPAGPPLPWVPGPGRHDDVVDALLAEAEILVELDHPGVVRVRDLVRDGSRYALVLDLINGADLRRRLRAGGPLPPSVASEVVPQVADALSYLHARGIVHGDIKPGNIVVPDDGQPVRLVDFGAARRVPLTGEPDGARGATHATPEYVAPEVIAGRPPGPAADVYALGMVLYELLAGRSAYRGGSAGEVLARHANCVPVAPAGMPEPVWPIIMACLELDPAGRPQAATLADRLRAIGPALAGLAPLAPPDPDAVTWRPRLANRASQDTRQDTPAASGPPATPGRSAPLGRSVPADPRARRSRRGGPGAWRGGPGTRPAWLIGAAAALVLVAAAGGYLALAGVRPAAPAWRAGAGASGTGSPAPTVRVPASGPAPGAGDTGPEPPAGPVLGGPVVGGPVVGGGAPAAWPPGIGDPMPAMPGPLGSLPAPGPTGSPGMPDPLDSPAQGSS